MSITTTPEFWDCECEHDYIHFKHEGFCRKCWAKQYDSPDSRVDEVEKYFGNGTSGQDRKSYTDDQDRESYIVD